MTLILVLQCGIPALMVAWFLLRPPRSAVGIGVQLAGSLLVLLLLRYVGIWLFPPWWLPHVAAALVLLAAARVLWQPDQLSVWPAGRTAIMGTAFWVGVAVLSMRWYTQAASGHHPPDHPTAIDLAAPLRNGTYLVVNGGGTLLINAHRASSDPTNLRLQPWRGNGHAVDLVALNGWGLRARGLRPRDPAQYLSFGVAVVSPCHGEVVAAVDGLPDMPVPTWDRDNMAGNHLLLACQGVHVLLGHLQQHSVSVAVGQSIRTGDSLGAIGNSGGTDEPHLHIHAQLPGPASAPFAGDPVPMRVDGQYLVRGARPQRP